MASVDLSPPPPPPPHAIGMVFPPNIDGSSIEELITFAHPGPPVSWNAQTDHPHTRLVLITFDNHAVPDVPATGIAGLPPVPAAHPLPAKESVVHVRSQSHCTLI